MRDMLAAAREQLAAIPARDLAEAVVDQQEASVGRDMRDPHRRLIKGRAEALRGVDLRGIGEADRDLTGQQLRGQHVAIVKCIRDVGHDLQGADLHALQRKRRRYQRTGFHLPAHCTVHARVCFAVQANLRLSAEHARP